MKSLTSGIRDVCRREEDKYMMDVDNLELQTLTVGVDRHITVTAVISDVLGVERS